MRFTGKVIPLCKECLANGNAQAIPCPKHDSITNKYTIEPYKPDEQVDGKTKASGKD